MQRLLWALAFALFSSAAAAAINLNTATKEELFRASDFLSVHVPLTAQTRHAVGEAELAPRPRAAGADRGPTTRYRTSRRDDRLCRHQARERRRGSVVSQSPGRCGAFAAAPLLLFTGSSWWWTDRPAWSSSIGSWKAAGSTDR